MDGSLSYIGKNKYSNDYGLISLKFFNYWMGVDGFDEAVRVVVVDFRVKSGWSKFIIL